MLRSHGVLLVATVALFSACSSDPPTDNPAGAAGTTAASSSGAGGGSGGGGSGGAGALGCTTPTAPPCSDEAILQMNLKKTVVPAKITSKKDGAGWISSIDATAGGFGADPTSYTYGKFSDTGLEKVAISDETSLDSMDWDIAFRRYVVRINSGNSGPSCVKGARTKDGTMFDAVTAVPDGLKYASDEYFTPESCDLIPDGQGLPSSPATTLSSYYTYSKCLAMTNHVFVLALADGKQVKLTIDDYYTPAVQDQCNTTDAIPMANTGSGNFIVRWAFLP